jgi:hypothetical protein
MAVAPDSSFAKRAKRVFIFKLLGLNCLVRVLEAFFAAATMEQNRCEVLRVS